MKHPRFTQQIILAGLLSVATLLPAATVQAAQAAPAAAIGTGEQLHAKYCTGCHDSSVYTRKDHQIRSLDALNGQLRNCAHMTGQALSEGELQRLAAYLDQRYYHFR